MNPARKTYAIELTDDEIATLSGLAENLSFSDATAIEEDKVLRWVLGQIASTPYKQVEGNSR